MYLSISEMTCLSIPEKIKDPLIGGLWLDPAVQALEYILIRLAQVHGMHSYLVTRGFLETPVQYFSGKLIKTDWYVLDGAYSRHTLQEN